MSTWGTGLFASDCAQDLLDEMREAAVDARLGKVTTILERTAADPSMIMREYVPEEIIVAAAVVAATLPADPHPDWVGDEALEVVIAGIEPQRPAAAPAA
jgi:hypothetical protein